MKQFEIVKEPIQIEPYRTFTLNEHQRCNGDVHWTCS